MHTHTQNEKYISFHRSYNIVVRTFVNSTSLGGIFLFFFYIGNKKKKKKHKLSITLARERISHGLMSNSPLYHAHIYNFHAAAAAKYKQQLLHYINGIRKSSCGYNNDNYMMKTPKYSLKFLLLLLLECIIAHVLLNF